jgi:hypothetical protein
MALRFNIRKVKQLVWLLCVATLGYAGWTFFDIYSKKEAGDYSPRKSTIFRDVLQRDIGDASRDRGDEAFYPPERYEQTWKTLVSGEVRESAVAEQEPPPEPPKPKLPELETIAKVNLVFYSADPVSRFIALSYKGEEASGGQAGAAGKARRLHLSEGDPLRPPYDDSPYNGRVLAIGLQEVTFQWGEGEVVLTPRLGADGAGVPQSQFEVDEYEDLAAKVPEAPEQSVELAPGQWLMGTQDIERLSQDPQTFLTEQVNVRTITMPDGGRSQLEITHVEPGSVAAKYGAQPKDRIISVNGIPMNSVAGAVAWFKQNSDLPAYDVVYERAGKQQSLTIHVK